MDSVLRLSKSFAYPFYQVRVKGGPYRRITLLTFRFKKIFLRIRNKYQILKGVPL